MKYYHAGFPCRSSGFYRMSCHVIHGQHPSDTSQFPRINKNVAVRIVSVDTPSNKPSIILNILIASSIIGVFGGSTLSIAFLVKSLLPSPTSWNPLASAAVLLERHSNLPKRTNTTSVPFLLDEREYRNILPTTVWWDGP